MFCTHCGTKVEGGPSHCPNCGELLPQPIARPKTPFWLKVLFCLGLLGLIWALILFSTHSDPTIVVEGQLEKLNSKEMTQAYYDFTSKEFKQATSLERFKALVNKIPDIQNISKFEFLEVKEDGNNATLKVRLDTVNRKTMIADYQLVKEDDSWRIKSFTLTPPELIKEEAPASPLSKENLESPESIAKIESDIEKFIDYIKEGQYKKAYDENTSIGFKEATSYNDFKDVLSGYGFFTENELTELNFFESQSPIESYKASLTSDTGEEGSAQFDMIKNGDSWKIEQILIFKEGDVAEDLEPAETPSINSTDLVFESALISEKADDKGLIKESKSVLTSLDGDIYVNLILLNTTKGESINLTLYNPELKIMSPPIEHVVQMTAKKYIAMFKFDTRKDGWPKGNYQLDAEAKNSESSPKTFEFKIE